MISLIAAAATLISASGPAVTTAEPRCTIIRYAPDGRRTERVGDPAEFGVDVRISAGQASVSARSGGSASSRSTVSASSSTDGGGHSVTSSTLRDGDRTITTETNATGCIVVIDERPVDRRQ